MLDVAGYTADHSDADAGVGRCVSAGVPGRRPLEAVAWERRGAGDRRGPRGRRSAVNGVAAMAVSSAVVHLAVKPLGGRRRPDRVRHQVPMARQVSMPTSTSFPSGHAASAAAFATGVATAFPEAGIPLSAAAALVAYSRVHTGVHYPVDVIAGTVVGTTVAQLVVALLDRGRKRRTVAVAGRTAELVIAPEISVERSRCATDGDRPNRCESRCCSSTRGRVAARRRALSSPSRRESEGSRSSSSTPMPT